jgi:serine acetyltransferase
MSKIFSKLTNIQDGGENLPKISVWFNNFLKGYNHEKYWKRRAIVIDPNNKKNILVKIFYLIYIKRVDAKHHCSFGTSLHYGAQFKTPPNFPHGPNGIIVGYDAVFGESVTLYHQVTIPYGNVKVGDNTVFYPGAKVIQNVTIG